MSKDGPPISGGYRYGSLNALRASLPAKAINPRGAVSDADARARQNLTDFSAYPERAKSLGKPLPATQGVGDRRAAVIRKRQELRQHEERDERSVTLENGPRIIKLVFDNASKRFCFVEEDLALGTARRSFAFGSKDQAMLYYRLNRILWKKDRIPLQEDD